MTCMKTYGRFRRSAIIGTPAVIGLLALVATSALADDYFAGKEIEILVPFSEGGAVDVSARFLQPFLEQHIPGNPTVIVTNRPGGAGILGTNWFEDNARPDGTSWLFTSSAQTHPFMLGQPEVEYDLLNKPAGFSLSWNPIYYVAPETGITEAADLIDPAVPLIYGGIAAPASDLPQLIAFEVLGLDVTTVLGFPGRGPVRLAYERGETNFDFQATPAYLALVAPLVEEGRAIPVMTGGTMDEDGRITQRDLVMADLSTVYETHIAIHGEPPSGPAWEAYNVTGALTFVFGFTTFLHEDTPQEALDALYAAIDSMNADPEFLARSEERTGGYPLTRGDEIQDAMRAALQPGGAVLSYILDLLETKYDVTF